MIKTYSIKDDKTFQKLITKGKWQGGNFISLYILPNGSDKNYLGLGIGKKVGKAYKRNHIKRLIKESYTLIEKELKHGYNLLFVWKSKALYENADFKEIYKDVTYLLSKAGLIK